MPKLRSPRLKKTNQSETNREKMKKVGEQWVGLYYYCCFESEVVGFGSTETLKLAVLLFCETTKISLFVLDSVKSGFGSSLVFFNMNRV
jgi:hypothetical protein